MRRDLATAAPLYAEAARKAPNLAERDHLTRQELLNGVSGPHTSLGGVLTSSPIAVSSRPGHVGVFTRGQANDSAFTPYYDLGAPPGGAVSEPGAAATSSGELVVFVRGGEVRTSARPIWRNSSFDGGATWTGWITVDAGHGTPSPNNPEATANAFGGWTVAATNFPTGARVGPLRACSSTL